MELIQKALEKARSAGRITKPGVPSPEVIKRPEKRQPPESGEVSVAATGIRYSHTKVMVSDRQHLERANIVASNVNDGNADLFRVLRTKVLQSMRDNGWRSLAVSGATPGVGKTTIAVNLAVSMAMDSNHTVLLVDVDLRRPKMAAYLGFEPNYGLGEYLEGKTSLDSALVNPGVERLVILPAKNSYSNSAELLSSARMTNLVDELERRYADRIVLFDLPPLLSSSDAMGFLPKIDCALLVVEDGGNTADQVAESIRLLKDTNLVGWVLNKSSRKLDGYYY